MTALTHAAFGTLCYFIVAACLWWTVSPAVAAVAVLGSLLPDIDIPTSAIGRPLFPLAGAINQQVGHRTLTHSLVGMEVVGFFAAPLLLFRPELYWALLIGYLSHLLIDTENKMGVELLWPSQLKAWFFKDEKYRIQVGSKGEFILLVVLLLLTAATFPLTYRGFTGTLHYLLGDMDSAISDFYRYMPTHDVLARVKAIDTISQERVEGELEVPVSSTGQALGAEGNGKLFVRQGDLLRELVHPGDPGVIALDSSDRSCSRQAVEGKLSAQGMVMRAARRFSASDRRQRNVQNFRWVVSGFSVVPFRFPKCTLY